MRIYDIKDFIDSIDFKSTNESSLGSKVRKGRLDEIQWTCKEMGTYQEAIITYLAQEFSRLIYPTQPETRFAMNSITGVCYILSEEVQGFKPLPLNQPENFRNGKFKELGQVLALSMFLQEINLYNGNIGLNEHNLVIKIDGDCCFAEQQYGGEFKLSPEAVDSLPFPKDYTTTNWLDIVHEKEFFPSTIVDLELSDSTQFRNEVNHALLKLCLIPDSFVQTFVDSYIDTEDEHYINFFLNGRDELLQTVLQNKSFLAYIQRPEILQEIADFFTQLYSYKSADENIFFIFNEADPQQEFALRYAEFIPLAVESKQLIDYLKLNLHPKDRSLKKFILNAEERFTNPQELIYLKPQLIQAANALKSPEYQAVKSTIRSFYERDRFYTIGMEKKGKRIEKALHNTPLQERIEIISTTETNSVKKKLANHRTFWHQSPTTTTGEIDYELAATSYKKLKNNFG
ncbi:MAG: hypothetical protein H0U70_10535 [Tatlockia sp.]|nr:hypothetical protein [Tatlockia sp.]